MEKTRNQKGILVIEILVVVTIIVVGLASLLGVFGFYLRAAETIKRNTEANYLAQEAIEAVRNFRDNTDWNTNGLGVLSMGVAYYPQEVGSPPQWALPQGTETINGFTRRVVFLTVNRDSNSNIVDTGGILDPLTKKVEVYVSWGDKEVKITTYLTHWRQ